MKKRALSIALALCLCLALLPVSALAADSDFDINNETFLLKYNGAGGAVVIPDGVTEIANSAFKDCINVTSVVIPDGVTSIYEDAFGGCTSLTSVNIPDSVTYIAGYAFRGCTSLTSVNIPAGATDDGVYNNYTFSGCTSLANVNIENGVTRILAYMFEDCTSLTSITIPGSVAAIAPFAFYGCTNLTNVTIENGVTRIDNSAFRDCTSLTSITIPNSVTVIGSGVFEKNTTIYGVVGSAAEKWSKDFGYKFVATTGETNPLIPTETPSTWAVEPVNTAITNNLVPQDLQAKYTQATTRAEFCALAVALYESIRGEITGRKEFTDTTDINVQKCAFIGVVNGTNTEQTIFSPNTGLTREQAATMISRLANAIGKPLTQQAATFNDNGSIATWAADAVGQVQAAGIMGGVSTTEPIFDPQGAYTREQSIVTMLRLFDIVK